MSEDTIRILIADDHAVVRKGLLALIETETGMEVVGEAADGTEAVEMAASLRPDVILLDLVMPRMDGIGAIQGIREHDPEARILVLTSFSEDDKVLTAIEVGAMGCLLKDATPEELLRAIRDVHQGQSALNPEIARKVIQRMRKGGEKQSLGELTSREVEVLRCIGRGLSNRQIGEELFISEPTVRTHVSNILMKLELPNRTQAALFAVREGLVSSEG
ncbi:MAG: response regulator transcription factor [Spirochaetaceae bacterium]|nr:MAG: response regulator transcription factor [Spirochaetaceae bacterium]